LISDRPLRNFFQLALTDTLRNASKAATGWPYIAPAKLHERAREKEALNEFVEQVTRMISDLQEVQKLNSGKEIKCLLIKGDARVPVPDVQYRSVSLAITSPPYLNNYDYADRTRLETYFFGWYRSWGEITRAVRTKLITAATTQVVRGRQQAVDELTYKIREADPKLYVELRSKIEQLSELRLKKGGKKSYDLMVARYFNDMADVLSAVFLALKNGGDFVLVLGDSAPYGVHIPTEEYLARIALGLGYSAWQVERLRARGEKWRTNPQRHKVMLKEVILTLTK
ncbi:MAG: hypothetical protein AB1744_15765, partial [Candidatus Zixiibacteriota bacterium]